MAGAEERADMKVLVEKDGPVTTITINRPEVRNAIDKETAELLASAFREFESDDESKVAVLRGAEGQFSSGADLKAWSKNEGPQLSETGDSPLGPIRMNLSKPVIAAVAGYSVAGGMALALWCDLRVVEETAVFGMLDRRFGVPMIGAVTVKLPKLIGLSHAMDIILTGRQVDANEAYRMGLANRIAPHGQSRKVAEELARELAGYPWLCLVNDRKALLEGMDLSDEAAQRNEFRRGMATIQSGETLDGAGAFASGKGRHGKS